MNLDDKDAQAITTPRDERIRFSLGEILDGQKWYESLLWHLGIWHWRITNVERTETALLVSARGIYGLTLLALLQAFLTGICVGAWLVKNKVIDW